MKLGIINKNNNNRDELKFRDKAVDRGIRHKLKPVASTGTVVLALMADQVGRSKGKSRREGVPHCLERRESPCSWDSGCKNKRRAWPWHPIESDSRVSSRNLCKKRRERRSSVCVHVARCFRHNVYRFRDLVYKRKSPPLVLRKAFFSIFPQSRRDGRCLGCRPQALGSQTIAASWTI